MATEVSIRIIPQEENNDSDKIAKMKMEFFKNIASPL